MFGGNDMRSPCFNEKESPRKKARRFRFQKLVWVALNLVEFVSSACSASEQAYDIMAYWI